MMKVLRSKDWKLIGYLAHCAFMGSAPAFLFQQKTYGDVLVLNEAKYIDVEHDKVFFFDANSSKKVYASRSCRDTESEQLVSQLRAICSE